jgi:hypothetical protein
MLTALLASTLDKLGTFLALDIIRPRFEPRCTRAHTSFVAHLIRCVGQNDFHCPQGCRRECRDHHLLGVDIHPGEPAPKPWMTVVPAHHHLWPANPTIKVSKNKEPPNGQTNKQKRGQWLWSDEDTCVFQTVHLTMCALFGHTSFLLSVSWQIGVVKSRENAVVGPNVPYTQKMWINSTMWLQC